MNDFTSPFGFSTITQEEVAFQNIVQSMNLCLNSLGEDSPALLGAQLFEQIRILILRVEDSFDSLVASLEILETHTCPKRTQAMIALESTAADLQKLSLVLQKAMRELALYPELRSQLNDTSTVDNASLDAAFAVQEAANRLTSSLTVLELATLLLDDEFQITSQKLIAEQ